MQDIVKLLKSEVIDKIDRTVTVESIIDETLNEIEVTFCSLKWLRNKDWLVDANFENWAIIAINFDTNAVRFLRPSGSATLQKRQVLTILRPITFVHGTKRTANFEWLGQIQQDVRVGTPLIWLYESINGDRKPMDNAIDFDSNLRVFFLDEVDWTGNSLNDEIREQGVRPMLALADAFFNALDSSYKLDMLSNAPINTMSRFGNEDNAGVISRILDANLGGVEARPTLSVYKGVECCN